MDCAERNVLGGLSLEGFLSKVVSQTKHAAMLITLSIAAIALSRTKHAALVLDFLIILSSFVDELFCNCSGLL